MNIVCPSCRKQSSLAHDTMRCRHCGRVFKETSSAILDFVSSPATAEERSFYDATYLGARTEGNGKQSIHSVEPYWHLPQSPEDRIVLEKLGDIAGKSVLLLGNGASVKELLFLSMNPAHLVYSDLSPQALMNICDRFDLSQYQERLTFAAIDAQDIPFAETFDVIYAYAMVHHLPDLDRFFTSIIRALKPGGYTVFMDDAFAPLWHYSKRTWLRPLMKLSHKQTGISPEDYRFTLSGGFKESDLTEKIRMVGGEPWFVRTSFLTYLFYRASSKLLPKRLNKLLRRQSLARAIVRVDKWLCKVSVAEANQIRLIWGLNKPVLEGADNPVVAPCPSP